MARKPKRNVNVDAEAYTYGRDEATRKNIPEAGLIDVVSKAKERMTSYCWDPRESPQLVRAGKAGLKIVNVLREHIAEKGSDGSAVVLPRIERFRATGSTREVFFRPGRPVRETMKSHISHVVLDAPVWEGSAVHTLEHSDFVECYARNDHLDFTLPYVDDFGNPHVHRPDFIVKLATGLMVALEVKGQVRELEEFKIKAGLRWAEAVNRYYGERKWVYHVCFNPPDLPGQLASLAG